MTEKQLYDALDPLIKKKYEKRFVRSVCGIDDLLQKKRYIYDLKETEGAMLDLIDLLNELHDENQRLTDKLNQTALELVDEVISQGKAVEISEMSYSEFLDYRAKNGKPMELHND